MSESSARSARRALVAIALCAAAAGGPALADTVVLRNGDRLSGTIRHLSPDKLTLSTRWGGEIAIDRAEVASFSTDGPVPWSPQWGGEPRRATFGTAPAPGVVTIDEGDGPRQVPMSRVALLKPTPQETENGVARKGRVTFSTGWSEGNSDSQRIWGEADLAARARDWRYDLGLKLRRESDGGQTTADRWLATGNYDRFVTETRFRYLRGSLERDRFKDLTLRSAAGGGYGVQMIDTERTQLSVRGGLDLVDENRIATPDDTHPAAGWGVDFKHRIGFASAEMFHDQQGFWNLEDTGQMTVRSRTGLRLPVRAGITASLQVNLDWEREPSPGRRSTDTTWLLGLGYQW
ncbi:DUF481 domain-containing protein [Burkholderiaceae bacterium FT117]|uniref:DUF481 domain-containing protein n=1 Tax=Zeimonas sediminis TaxID=2944268 RepID=UPI002342EDE5|nr:DUF481 domain-containing protein [Zeimonas sediminis]MCM5570004.1 DUF481 domain-containing protein [Zeimonas sediminis]